MIIVFSGLHGTGKSTIAKNIAQHYHFNHYSTGDIFRMLAKEQGMDLATFSKYAENHTEIDIQLDNRIKDYAKSGKSYVFDGQMPAFLLKNLADYKILLQCDENERIARMVLRDNQTLAAKKQETLIREESERQRFIEIYHIDILDPQLIQNTYDLILETTHLTIYQVTERCIQILEEKFPHLIQLV
jgi:CMP/dCMP kinase